MMRSPEGKVPSPLSSASPGALALRSVDLLSPHVAQEIQAIGLLKLLEADSSRNRSVGIVTGVASAVTGGAVANIWHVQMHFQVAMIGLAVAAQLWLRRHLSSALEKELVDVGLSGEAAAEVRRRFQRVQKRLPWRMRARARFSKAAHHEYVSFVYSEILRGISETK